MQWLSQLLVDNLLLGSLVMTRMAALLVAIPTLTNSIPKRVKLILVVLLTIVVMPSVTQHTSSPDIHAPVELAIAIVREAILGLLIGSAIQLIITGIQLSGEFMASTGGLQLGQTTDHQSGEQIPTMAKLVGLLVVAVLFAAGGHRIVMAALLESFQKMPPGQVLISGSMLDLVIDQLSAGVIAGIKVAAPVVAAMLLTNIVTGLISRTLPQINVLAVGLSINTLAFLVVTALTIGSAGLIFQEELGLAAERISALW